MIHGCVTALIPSQQAHIAAVRALNRPLSDEHQRCNRLERAHVRYVENAREIIAKYGSCSGRKQVIDFSSTAPKQEEETSYRAIQRFTCIKSYLELIDTIVELDVVCELFAGVSAGVSDECMVCSHINETDFTMDGMPVCEQCGYVKSNVYEKSCVNVAKSNYMDSENFQRILAKYEGFITLEDSQMELIIEKLDKYFVGYGKPSGEQVRALPHNEYGWKDGTSYELMNQALQSIKMPIYDCVSSICAKYWGYKLPDISHVKKQVLEDYVASQPYFMDIIKKYPELRSSSLNTRFRAFKHLEARGANVREEEFRIIKTHGILVVHDRIWKVMCAKSGIPYIPSV